MKCVDSLPQNDSGKPVSRRREDVDVSLLAMDILSKLLAVLLATLLVSKRLQLVWRRWRDLRRETMFI